MDFNILQEILPMDICILIGEFNYEHRIHMTQVVDELLHKHYFKIHRDYLIDLVFQELFEFWYEHNRTNRAICDNIDQCEHIFDREDGISYMIGIIEEAPYIFCSESCASYGEWSILYEERKRISRYQNNSQFRRELY
jgi:hypothetical protein